MCAGNGATEGLVLNFTCTMSHFVSRLMCGNSCGDWAHEHHANPRVDEGCPRECKPSFVHALLLGGADQINHGSQAHEGPGDKATGKGRGQGPSKDFETYAKNTHARGRLCRVVNLASLIIKLSMR